MKRFNISKTHCEIMGRKLPINCVFGNFNNIPYYIDDFTTHTKEVKLYVDKQGTYFKEKREYLSIWVFNYPKQHWVKANTSNPKHRELGLFVMPLLTRNNINSNTIVKPYIDYTSANLPYAKKAQIFSESPFSPHVGYALSGKVETNQNVVFNSGWDYSHKTAVQQKQEQKKAENTISL